MSLLSFTEKGIFCNKAGFYIDPWHKVDKAIITHAHADHSRWGMKNYLAHIHSVPIMKHRLGQNISIQGLDYGKEININGVKVSLHPAGHIIGSSQIKVEYKGEVWVVSGDYKLSKDNISQPFESIKCTHFVSESTFGLPIFKWRNQDKVFEEINHWWQKNAQNGISSILLGYSLGKAQRIIANVDASIGKIFVHGSIAQINEAYGNSGIGIKETFTVNANTSKEELKKGLIVAPPSVMNNSWLHKFEPYEIGVCSGWMTMRGTRRRQNIERGFVISDHADWDELNQAIASSEAEKIYVTHGYTDSYVKFLREQGLDAEIVKTQFVGENINNESETEIQEKE